MSKLLKKMSSKTLGVVGKLARDSQYAPTAVGPDGLKAPTAGAIIPLYMVYGQCSDTKMFESDYGVSTALVGEFEAVVLQPGVPNHGKQFSSGKLFLPTGISEVVEGALKNVGSDGRVEFGIKISSQWHDSEIGWEYVAENLRKAAPTDALAHLRGAMQEYAGDIFLGPPAIEAPAKPPAQLPAPGAGEAAPAAPIVEAAAAGNGQASTEAPAKRKR